MEEEEKQKVETLCKVSEKFIMMAILHYLETCLKPAYEEQQATILQSSGKCLRFDYTYDYATGLKAYDPKKEEFVTFSSSDDRFESGHQFYPFWMSMGRS